MGFGPSAGGWPFFESRFGPSAGGRPFSTTCIRLLSACQPTRWGPTIQFNERNEALTSLGRGGAYGECHERCQRDRVSGRSPRVTGPERGRGQPALQQ